MFPKLRSLTDLPEEERRQREAVIAEARTWIGTPYYWLADRKGVGVDCAMLLVRCYVDTGAVAPLDPRPYPVDWHLHHSEEKYLSWMDQLGHRVDQPAIGDIVLFKYGRTFSHSGIIVGQTRMIHSYLRDEMCRLSDIHESDFHNRPMLFYSVWR